MEKAGPSWLRNPETGRAMELDMYSEERSVAIEYDGPQHYEYPNGCHETRWEYEAQRERDRSKDRQCAARGVRLVRIRASTLGEELDELRGKLLTISVSDEDPTTSRGA
jgi:very-short-patch-repair endonuclease